MIDALILAGMLGSIALGFKDGLYRKIYGLLGFLGGLCSSLLLYTLVGDWFSSWFELPVEIARILAFAAVFLVFVVILNVLYRFVGEDKTKTIAVWSRFAGGFVGAFQGALFVSLGLLFSNRVGVIDELSKKESILYSSFIDFAPQVINSTMKWLPKSQAFIEELKGHS